MPRMLFRGLKGVNVSCTSPASTAISCSNMENQQPSMYQHGGCRSQQAHNLRGTHKARAFITPSFLSSKPKTQKQNGRNSSTSDEKPNHFLSPSSSSRCLLRDDSSYFDAFPDLELDPVPDMIQIDPSRFHFSEGDGSLDLNSSASFSRPKDHVGNYLRSSSTSAVTSTNRVRFDQTRDFDDDESEILRPSSVATRVQEQVGFRASTSSWSPATYQAAKEEEDNVLKKNKVVLKNSAIDGGPQEQNIGFQASTSLSSSARVQSSMGDETAVLKSSFSARSRDQVVVLRVSLHCKGCEGKVRKHLSRMQGVTSFSIDFVAKKVTVIGEVTPLGVLSSISKVKNAQLWTISET